MGFKETEQKIQQLHARAKELTTKREGIIRQAAVEEHRLSEAYERLRGYGVENPESLSTEELEALATKYRAELEQATTKMEQQIQEGERLLA